MFTLLPWFNYHHHHHYHYHMIIQNHHHYCIISHLLSPCLVIPDLMMSCVPGCLCLWLSLAVSSLQARSMGIYAAHCMARSVEVGRRVDVPSPLGHSHEQRLGQGQGLGDLDTVYGNSLLDMFAHITHFFGHKVVLLGRFNAQGLGARVQGCTQEMVITAGIAPLV